MAKRLFILTATALLLTACGATPRQELQTAQEDVARGTIAEPSAGTLPPSPQTRTSEPNEGQPPEGIAEPPLLETPIPPTPATITPPQATPKRPQSAQTRGQKKTIIDYTVAEGETLWTIASRRDIYGDALLWPLIYKANRDQIKDPRQIYPGQNLTIPREASDQDKEAAREVARRSDIFPLDLIIRNRPAETP